MLSVRVDVQWVLVVWLRLLSNTDFISQIKASKGNFGSFFKKKMKRWLYFGSKKYIRCIFLHIMNINCFKFVQFLLILSVLYCKIFIK